jgi:hypothetical protein
MVGAPPAGGSGPRRRLDEAEAIRIIDHFICGIHKLLRKPGFTWAEHGEALLRRRKPWYYESEPRPGVSVVGERLSELAAGGRRSKFSRTPRVPRTSDHS